MWNPFGWRKRFIRKDFVFKVQTYPVGVDLFPGWIHPNFSINVNINAIRFVIK